MTTDEAGPWDAATFDTLKRWDPPWAALAQKMTDNPWAGALDRKTVELISVAINAACTNLNPEGTRRHVRRALAAGAMRDEILQVLKMASVMALHSCSLGAPILLEEARTAGVSPTRDTNQVATPACDKMRAAGQWNDAWNPFLELDPTWTDEVMAAAVAVYGSGVMSPKLVELLSIAFDASYTHMYAPGTRRHIKSALQLGCSVEEIMDVLKLCVAQGVQACNMGIPILEEELGRQTMGKTALVRPEGSEN